MKKSTVLLTIKSPLRIQVGSKTTPLNMNWYRNAHHFISNKAKQEYKKEIAKQFPKGLLLDKPIRIKYRVTFGDNRSKDVGNFVSVIEKFFLDALVQEGILPDDTSFWVPESGYVFLGVDKENGESCIIEVCEYEKTATITKR